jgi:hypothetical protein
LDTDSIFHIKYQFFSAEVSIPKDLKRAEDEPSDEFMVSVNAQSVDDTAIHIELDSGYHNTNPIGIAMEDRDAIAFAKAILHLVSLRKEYNRVKAIKE